MLIKVRNKIETDVILGRGQKKECERKKTRWERKGRRWSDTVDF